MLSSTLPLLCLAKVGGGIEVRRGLVQVREGK